MRILLIENEKESTHFISKGLQEESFFVDVFSSAEEAEKILQANEYDLILLEVTLPQKSGFEFLRTLRKNGNETPAIILTKKNDISDKRSGFQSGCDDYLTKPFHFEELVLRIKALLKRRQALPRTLQMGLLFLNPDTRQVQLENKQINLTRTEFSLLLYFMSNPQRVLTRTQILAQVWQSPFDPGTNVVDVTINSLRKKIHLEGDYPKIVTIYGVGYALQYMVQKEGKEPHIW